MIEDPLSQEFIPVTADAVFSGISTFAKLPWVQCLARESDVPFDIAFLGAPFVPILSLLETVLIYHRTLELAIGQVLGSVQVNLADSYLEANADGFLAGIREGSRRLTLYGGYNVPLQANPFRSGLRIVDCGDIPVT